jgi:putative flippase GtrA
MLRSWVRFNAVGIIGLVVQLLVLAVLLRFGLHYLAATTMAVEAAVLHNFLWHERWTWSERPVPQAGRGGCGDFTRSMGSCPSSAILRRCHCSSASSEYGRCQRTSCLCCCAQP